MLTYDVNNRGQLPLYEYIYTCIREDILSGRIKSGEKLPSKREMATENGIALITVENAYEQLIIEGYVEARQRRGYFVADVDISSGSGTNNARMVRGKLGAENKINDTRNVNNKKPNIKADFASASMQSDAFPYTIWAKLMRKVISDRELDFGQAPQAEGVYELREAIAEYLLRVKNLDVEAERIIIGPGTEYLHSILLQLIGRNRLVAVEDPGYKKAERIYESNGLKVMHIPVDESGIAVDKLYGSNIRLLHVSPAHHFPTGTVMPAARRHRLISWAVEQDSYIIEDDYDSEFRFRGRPIPTLMSLDNEHVIYMNTFTGSLAPSIRIAYMVLPVGLKQIYSEKLSYISGTVSTFEQLALAAFISEGYYERHINRMRNKYRNLNSIYNKALVTSELGKHAIIENDTTGLHCILNIECDIPDGVIIEKLAEAGILMRAMKDYCYNTAEKYTHSFILRYVEYEENELVDVFNDIEDIIFN